MLKSILSSPFSPTRVVRARLEGPSRAGRAGAARCSTERRNIPSLEYDEESRACEGGPRLSVCIVSREGTVVGRSRGGDEDAVSGRSLCRTFVDEEVLDKLVTRFSCVRGFRYASGPFEPSSIAEDSESRRTFWNRSFPIVTQSIFEDDVDEPSEHTGDTRSSCDCAGVTMRILSS